MYRSLFKPFSCINLIRLSLRHQAEVITQIRLSKTYYSSARPMHTYTPYHPLGMIWGMIWLDRNVMGDDMRDIMGPGVAHIAPISSLSSHTIPLRPYHPQYHLAQARSSKVVYLTFVKIPGNDYRRERTISLWEGLNVKWHPLVGSGTHIQAQHCSTEKM